MSASNITSVYGRRVWDSRGNPTVEVVVGLRCGAFGRGIAPAGASRGVREATDMRDGGIRLNGMDVKNALARISENISPLLMGRDALDQAAIDMALIQLDGTDLKSVLGGNAMVATSLAVLHAAAACQNQPLWQYAAEKYNCTPSVPLPEIQIFGGGAHAQHRVDVQDFMIMVPGANSFDEVMEITAEIYAAAGSIIKQQGASVGVADEGGWWPVFKSNEDTLEALVAAIELAGEKPGERVVISLDIAASEFRSDGQYRFALENRVLSTEQLIQVLGEWLEAYPIVSIEDPLAEDDLEGMRAFTQAHGSRVQVIGDDYLVTNADLVADAASRGACNAVLIKVNQAGTVTESVDAILAAEKVGYRSIVSARSGETEDVSIAHLAVGLNVGQLKVGSFARSERMAKWNECLRIQDALGDRAFVAGRPLANTWWGRQ